MSCLPLEQLELSLPGHPLRSHEIGASAERQEAGHLSIDSYVPLIEGCSWDCEHSPAPRLCWAWAKWSSLAWGKAWEQNSSGKTPKRELRANRELSTTALMKSGDRSHGQGTQNPCNIQIHLTFRALSSLLFNVYQQLQTWEAGLSHLGTSRSWELRPNSISTTFGKISRSWNDGPYFKIEFR